MKNKQQIWEHINRAVKEDKKEFPSWPDHIAGQVGRITASTGKMMDHAIAAKYGAKEYASLNEGQIRFQAVRTIALCFRLLENLDKKERVEVSEPILID